MGMGTGCMYRINYDRCHTNTRTVFQDILAQNPETHGSTFCPIILGSDKTTVSVAMGHNVYYPLYLSNRLIQNNVRRAHCNGVTLIAFLAILKSEYSTLHIFICLTCTPSR